MKEALKDWWEEPSDRVHKVQVEIEDNEDHKETEEEQDVEDEDASQDMTKDVKKVLDIRLITNNWSIYIILEKSIDESKEDNAILSDKSPFVDAL
uniref:Uncharacterized protein n=1 Tax=Amphimedon queenslandica TaxID=400682 RepID=A0A1X7TEU8_AMPQE